MPENLYTNILLFVFSVILLNSAYGDVKPIRLTDRTHDIVINGENLEFVEDVKDNISLNWLLDSKNQPFKTMTQDALNLGHTDSAVWTHFTISNQSNITTWIFQLEFPLLQRVDVFKIDENKNITEYNLGYEHPMSKRDLQHRFFVQPLKFKPGKTYNIFINAKRAGGNVQTPLRLSQPLPFFQDQYLGNYLFGIFYGIIIAMFLYNLFIVISLKDKAYFYYIGYVLFSFFTFQTLTGFGFLLLWPNNTFLNEYASQCFSLLTGIFALLFIKHFIKPDQYLSWTNKIIHFFVGTALLMLRELTAAPKNQ